MSNNYKYWNVGDQWVLRNSHRAMGKIMQALVMNNGRLHDSMEFNHYKDEGRSKNPVVLRISLPEGTEQEFEEYTGYKLESSNWFANRKVCISDINELVED